MIDLDDPIGQLPLGVQEYTTLRAYSVATIRNLLLFDVDILTYQDDYDPFVRDHFIVWQELLRKYLEYDKIVAARAGHRLSALTPSIHDALTAAGITEADASLLAEQGIETIGTFVDADLTAILDTAGAGNDTRSRISAVHKKLNPPIAPRRTPPVVTTRRGRKRRTNYHEIPEEPALSPEDFIKENISALGLNAREMTVLKELDVQSVEDFLALKLNSALDLPDTSEQTITRLTSWQKLYRKRLGWENSC